MWKRGIKVVRVTENDRKKISEQLVIGKNIKIALQNDIVFSTTVTSSLEKELAIGYVVSNQLIPPTHSIENVDYDTERGIVNVGLGNVSKPVITPPESLKSISTDAIFQWSAYFQEAAYLYKDTSISQTAALVGTSQLAYVSHDLHTLNAVDKVIGSCIAKETHFNKSILLVSGKISPILVQKAKYCGISVIISRLAPTALAYDWATQFGICLIGFSRGRRFTIYTGEKSIK